MKKTTFWIGFFIIAILIIGFSYAQTTFSFEKKPIRNILVSEFSNIPLVYSINLTHGLPNSDYYKFFTLLNARIFPNTPIKFEGFETKTIDLIIYVDERTPGKYAYSYYIKNSQEVYEDVFTFKIVKASDAFTFEIPNEINRDDDKFTIKIKNNLDVDFTNLTLEIKASFMDEKKVVSLKANEEKEIIFDVNEKIREEYAGKKKITIILASGKDDDEKYVFEREILLKEYENVVSKEESKFIFIGKKIAVSKKNEGNNETEVSVAIKVNAFEKLFVKANRMPDEIKKEGGNYVYIFKETLKPGESLEVIIEINYAWLIIIILILLIIALVYYYRTKERVIVRKSVKKVRTKSGHFALKVFLTIKNKTKKTIKEVALLDYLPLSMRYYEYGLTLPDDVKGNKLYWAIGELLAGEEKDISYLCYSKIDFEGKLVLPKAKIKYVDEKGKHIVYSNSPSIFIEKEEIERK